MVTWSFILEKGLLKVISNHSREGAQGPEEVWYVASTSLCDRESVSEQELARHQVQTGVQATLRQQAVSGGEGV